MATGNMKDIKRRIKSVQSTMQITKAMELVASSKLRRARERVQQSKPYFETLYSTMCRIAADTREKNSVYIREREVKKSLFIVIAGDRGLAGGYNANVLKLADAGMKGKEACIIAVGKKAQEYYSKRSYEMVGEYPGIAEGMRISDTHDIVSNFLNLFQQGEIDEVFLSYTEFVSPMVQEAKCIKLLPLELDKEAAPQEKPQVLTEYDPSPEVVFNYIIPEYLGGVLYGAVVEAYASEQSARRLAMETASDNAKEMIDSLSLSYNRARQAAITQEITEIVAGSGLVG